MNNKIKILLFTFFISYCGFSQEENNPNYSSEIFNSEQASLNLLSNITMRQLNVDNANAQNQQNSVFIQQVGYGNSIYTQTRAQSSNLQLSQNGDFNDIDMFVNAPNVNANVFQNGNSNTVLDNVYYSNLDVKLNAVQNGNNLTINRIGVNSLTNKIQLVQEGSFKTITVISN